MKIIERKRYLERLIRHMWNGDIKVITGVRRCGKSVLLFELFHDYLLQTGVKPQQIIKIQLDQRRYYRFRNPITLCEHVEGIITADRQTRYYLFIDEVQFTVPVRDEAHGNVEVTVYDMLNELKAYKNVDVYVTGSNSRMLSKDVATEFRGRATQIPVYPLSFEEFYSFTGGDKRSVLDDYMLYGGMPRITALTDAQEKKHYLSSLYSEIYIKDIVERHGIEREDVLGSILDYTASQIGSLTNPTNIANALTSLRKEKIYTEMVASYIRHATDAFLVYSAQRYDVKGKSYFSYPKKYYYTDSGLRNARLNYRQYDPGHLMENIIYNDLIRRGYSVDVGAVTERKNNEKIQREIDFVVNSGDRRVYIQSAYRLEPGEKTDSELKSLRLTGDFFRKVIIRMDIPHNFYDDNGIYHCNLIDFLLGEEDIF